MFLSMAVTFAIVAIISGVFGFVVVAGTAAWIAKAVFFVSLVTLGVSIVMEGQSSYRNKIRSSH
jgi:uncharacterized membrane protein YtjA (UPF0391 family)